VLLPNRILLRFYIITVKKLRLSLIKFKKKNFLCSYSKKIHHEMDFFTGKLQDLGLKFSHETPKVAAGGLAYKRNFFF